MYTHGGLYGDNVNCLPLVLSLRLYTFALVLFLSLSLTRRISLFLFPWCRCMVPGQIWIQHKYKRPIEIQARPHAIHKDASLCNPYSNQRRTIHHQPTSSIHISICNSELHRKKRIVNKFIDREFCRLVLYFRPPFFVPKESIGFFRRISASQNATGWDMDNSLQRQTKAIFALKLILTECILESQSLAILKTTTTAKMIMQIQFQLFIRNKSPCRQQICGYKKWMH